jgi:hypothetical protein
VSHSLLLLELAYVACGSIAVCTDIDREWVASRYGEGIAVVRGRSLPYDVGH